MGISQRFAYVLLFLSCWSAIEAEYVKYKDPKRPLNVRLDDLLSRMTLHEKMAQMAQIERKNATADVLEKYSIGSVLSEGGSTPAPQASAKAWVDMINEMQKAALSSRLGIPIIYGIDAVHGHNTVYNATIFPHNIGLGATRYAEIQDGAAAESYSEDPTLVELMTEIIPGLQGDLPQNSLKGVPYVAGRTKVAACAKHYVGDGGTHLGINENNTITNFHGLLSVHMPPYYHAIIKGVSTVMVSYSSWNGKKMHANHYLLTDFLKNKLRFRGFIISDYQGIDRITTPPGVNYTYSLQDAVLAGIDMIMIPYDYPQFFESFIELVDKKVIPISRIDDAVRRILRVKFSMGLFENPFGDYSLADEIGKQVCRLKKKIEKYLFIFV
ncbi:hypothetical protein HPP92_016015 [Vanilla planifolia]|uniref:Glycoside hydrolase family 3 N-terminal domain-containing protein n=1 Tax=Vanilla planifolia TaxID=51239 RepID=A0A835QFC4_VANPL|nr:hypothetical protein HPP92_016631 [Vanilla planifolia]KAG0471469.1 hypothetical protein HPP92_016015 [Vanilla planifolia]